ncbi:hypothetical protein ACGFZQ_51350 [Streptomyces sp. NPDC048254]|uniref:hypothetical protein n=1 Tax=Streptomyces sp. NPDC048254 TaxID=3365525 RepID=UPI003716C4D1
MTTSLPYAYGTRPVAERADRGVAARHRPEARHRPGARAAVGGRVIVEDRMAGSPEQRSRA